MADIDLDDLARGYAYRAPTQTTLARAVDAARGRHGTLIDVGGGTGVHAATWVGSNRLPIVVDRARQMCLAARKHPGVRVVQALSQALPLDDDVADLVYFHLSIHYGSYRDAIDEALRVAREGGSVEIWTFAPESMHHSALARWFPRIGDIDAKRFPPIDAIVDHLALRGASPSIAVIPETVERSARSWHEAVRNRFVSTIQLLTEEEIREGLDRFTVAYPDTDARYRYQIEFVRIRATR